MSITRPSPAVVAEAQNAWVSVMLFHEMIYGLERCPSRYRAVAAAQGQTLFPIDAIMAATAMGHGATLVTGNTKDFANLGVALLDPFATIKV